MSIWTIMGLFTVTAVMSFALLVLIIILTKDDYKQIDEDEDDKNARERHGCE